MNCFKEYDGSQKKISRWLPWACLVSPGTVENKDGSFIGAFLYREKSDSSQDAIKYIQKLLRAFGSGWVWWAERRYVPGDLQSYIVLCWHPRLLNGRIVNYPREFDLPKDISIPQSAFICTLNYLENTLGAFMDIRQLRDLALLQFLHDTVTPDSEDIDMSAIPLYLDAQLSQNGSYSISNSGLRVNNSHLKIISLPGFMEDGGALFGFLEKQQYKYRFVRRFVFFGMEDARREARRYMGGWCEGRQSILTTLDFSYSPDKVCGLLTNTLIVWHEDTKTLQEICDDLSAWLGKQGILSIVEQANQVDVWLGSVPAMFRCNIAPPLVELDDPAVLFI